MRQKLISITQMLLQKLAILYLKRQDMITDDSDPEYTEKDEEDIGYIQSAYKELISDYEGKLFSTPLQYIDMQQLFGDMHEAGYEPFEGQRESVFTGEEFEGLGALAAPFAEFSNIVYRFICKTTMEQMESNGAVELAVGEEGLHYVAKVDDEVVQKAVDLARVFQ